MMRYERKYKVEGLDLHQIQASIEKHPAGFTMQYPDRQVNNIYFDDMGFSSIQLHGMGSGERRKFRVRWYGESNAIQTPTFEVKSKQDELSKKTLIPIDHFDPSSFVSLLQYPKLASLGFLQPGLFNCYKRSYYVSFDGKFRLTIDRELEYRPFVKGFGIGETCHKETGAIIELKYDEENDPEWGQLAGHFPFRQTKSSKYMNGMMMMNA